MSQPKELFSHAATVFPVKDVEKSMRFYSEVLGFNINFKWGDPVSYAVLKRGEVSIHLTQKEGNSKPSNHTSLYVFVHDVDAVHDEFVTSNANITNPIGDRDYGMRDFDVTDPDGYLLAFGNGTKE